MLRRICKFTIKSITKPLISPIYRFSTIKQEEQRQKIFDLLDAIQPVNSVVKEIEYAHLRQHQLSQQLEQLALKNQLHVSQIIQSLNYLEQQRYVHPVLYMTYPYLNSLSDTALTFVFQKILAYKPPQLPEVPAARNITDNEMLFFLLAQIFEGKKLINWIQKVPFWQDNNRGLIMLSMGVFTIYQKMTKVQREQNSRRLNKCIQVIDQSISGGQFAQDLISILNLSLELNHPFAQRILKHKNLYFHELSSDLMFVLFMNLSNYLPNDEKSKIAEQVLSGVVQELLKLEWKAKNGISLMNLWNTFYKRSTHKGIWKQFSNKLMHLTIDHLNKTHIDQETQQILLPNDLVRIVQTLDKHYINKKQLLRLVLLKLQPHLYTINSSELTALVKSLSIYVKIEQRFFMHLRKVCDSRKSQFSLSEIKQLKRVYAKFQVLFSIPF